MSDSKHTIYGSRVEREIEHLRKMQSYYAFFLTDFTGLHTVAGNAHRVYLASEVDARIAELESALREARDFVGKSRCSLGHSVSEVQDRAKAGTCIYCKHQFDLYNRLSV